MGLLFKKIIRTDESLLADGNLFLYLAKDEKTGMFGMYDKITNKLISKVKYEEIKKFTSNVAIFIVNNKYGLLNTNGNEIVKAKYDKIVKINEDTDLFLVKFGEKYGIINSNGQELFPFIYDEIKFISEGFYSVKKDGKYGVINRFENEFCEAIHTIFSSPIIYATEIKESNGRESDDRLKQLEDYANKQSLKRQTIASKERMIAYFIVKINQYYYNENKVLEDINKDLDINQQLNLNSEQIIEKLYDDEQKIYNEFDDMAKGIKNFELYDLVMEFNNIGKNAGIYDRLYTCLSSHIENLLSLHV